MRTSLWFDIQICESKSFSSNRIVRVPCTRPSGSTYGFVRVRVSVPTESFGYHAHVPRARQADFKKFLVQLQRSCFDTMHTSLVRLVHIQISVSIYFSYNRVVLVPCIRPSQPTCRFQTKSFLLNHSRIVRIIYHDDCVDNRIVWVIYHV